jgi:hypothetical protein
LDKGSLGRDLGWHFSAGLGAVPLLERRVQQVDQCYQGIEDIACAQYASIARGKLVKLSRWSDWKRDEWQSSFVIGVDFPGAAKQLGPQHSNAGQTSAACTIAACAIAACGQEGARDVSKSSVSMDLL